ncbi:MAG: UshA-like (seleno)protein [Planctomycetota bacterium]|nr:UshA-like (seleno)protein [Planctomycetota bacterium]
MPSSPTRSKLALFLVAFASVAILALPGCKEDPTSQPSDLTLLYTGNVHGYIEPCGCAAGQIGGIDRIAGYVGETLADLGPRGLFIDTGDLLASGPPTEELTVQQLRIKARGFFEVWAELGCSAIALGEAEVALGVREVAALADEFQVPVLCANIVDAQGQSPLPDWVIVERGGLKVGVFSVLAGTLNEVAPKKKPVDRRRYQISKLLRAQGLTLEPWKVRAAEVIAELRPQVDVLVCASHLGYDNNVLLAEAHPELDMIVGGHFGSSSGQTDVIAGTPVLTTRINGSRVGRMDWWLPNPGEYLANERDGTTGELVDVSMRAEAEIELEVAIQAYSDLAGMERKYGTAEWERKLATQEAMYELALERLRELEPVGEVNRFAHNQVPMHRGVTRSNEALAAVDEYHRATTAYWQARDAESPDLGPHQRAFVGPENCTACHPEQVEFWLGTRHSRAFATLEATSQAYDAECIGCHTVGFQVQGGFDLPTRSEGFQNVQCAACHGAGAAHVAGGKSYLLKGLINNGMNGCARCHQGEHDPTFEQTGAEKLLRVMCPPILPAGMHTSAMDAAYLEGATELRRRENPNWDVVSRAYNEAGELELALEVAKEWVAARPGNIPARLNLAERAINSEDYQLAIKNYRLVTHNQPDNPRGWMGLAISLFELERFDESLVAARECYALSPSESMAARIVGMGLMACGKPDEARAHFERHLGFHPEHEGFLADLMSQL